MSERLTWCEAGTIHHRPETALERPRRCRRGHLAPSYAVGGNCPACVKLLLYARRGTPLRGGGRLRRFADYARAAEHYAVVGGFLFRYGGMFCVTDNPATVQRLRGAAYLRHAEATGRFDEMEP